MKPETKQSWSKFGAIAILLLLAIFISLALASCAGNKSAVPYHEGLQREATFENRLDNLGTFTVKSAKSANSDLKEKIKEQEKLNSKNNKRKAIEEENAELRARLDEAKKNNK